ncbi:MAG TPA: hypothetical protein VIS73_07930 [Rhodocyclaceae bacterium]
MHALAPASTLALAPAASPQTLRQPATPTPFAARASLFAAALSELLRHQLSGCRHAAWKAADLLERLTCLPGLDDETRELCDRMSERLARVDGA